MIVSLRIENFVLIDSVKIEFRSGFTTITGETGSGKSILLSALNLILGERASLSVIGNRGDKSIVEAEFDISTFEMKSFFEEASLDYFDTVIVRREINKQGRSRAFINDSLVQLSDLKKFTSQLVHIHSQYNTLELKDLSYQLNLLDVLADLASQSAHFKVAFEEYKNDVKVLEDKKRRYSEKMAREDYNAFQLNELKVLNLIDINYEELRVNLKVGEHADEIISAYAAVGEIINGDSNVLSLLNHLKSSLSKKRHLDARLENLSNRLDAIIIELNDIAEEAELGVDQIEFDPRKLDEIVSQLDSFNRVLMKHGISSQEELMAIYAELSRDSENLDELSNEIKELELIVKKASEELSFNAKKLHENRGIAIPDLEKKIKVALQELKLENTKLKFNLSELADISQHGISKLEILFSPNLGIDPVPVHQAASGGELSRVMLALQSLMSSKMQLRTILFDEIDTGVSGDVAQKMGYMLKKMGNEMQVIAITHLPQVAGKGGQHLKVLKAMEKGNTSISVHDLNIQERIEETARLMSGDKINQSALDNAKTLIG